MIRIPTYCCFLILLLLAGGPQSLGQSLPAGSLSGADLRSEKQSLQKAVAQGQHEQSVRLAEVLFLLGNHQQAFEMYRKADSLGLVTSPEQQRNHAHLARILNKTSPYQESTGYFITGWDFEVEAKPHCVNSPNEDFAPYIWNNLLFITSSREDSRRRDQFTSKPFLSIFAFDARCNQVPIPGYLPPSLNTRWHDGPLSISADTTLLIITRNYEKPNEEGIHNLYLEFYVRELGQWGEARIFPYSRDAFSVQHPWYHDDTRTLYFSSDMPGGFGGFDLYKSNWNGQEWSPPANLGPDINSPYDEVFPSVSPEGHLVYATNHIETMGGLDIVLFRDGARYLFPAPINSPYDDFAMSFSSETQGYFSSNRESGPFADNIYAFSAAVPIPQVSPLYARLMDKETGTPLEGASVTFSTDIPEISGSAQTDAQGRILLFRDLAMPDTIFFNVLKNGYEPVQATITGLAPGDTILDLSLQMQPIEPLLGGSGQLTVYFEHDLPPGDSREPASVNHYARVFQTYSESRPLYYEKSASTAKDLDQFFQEMDAAMQAFQHFIEFMATQLDAGQSFSLRLSAFASPIASSTYNAGLGERRIISVKNHIRHWQGQQLIQHLQQNRILFIENVVGDALPGDHVSGDHTQPGYSIYSVEAARERRVDIVWEMHPAHPEAPETQVHYIVIGSFRRIDGAQATLQELISQGAPAPGIMKRNPEGFYRVYYNAYLSREAADQDIGRIRQTIAPGAWIYRQ